MKNPFGDKRDPEQQARDAIRRKKWSKAIAHYERKVQDSDRDLTLWNLLGDLHMNNHARTEAVDAWRHAMEGYALEGLHENVLGIARKILRRTPEEEDIHLIMAEAYLGLEYHADCLAAFRTYLKLSKRRSETDMRSLFKKILDVNITHLHLLEELHAIFNESAIEDLELERSLDGYINERRKIARETHPVQTQEPAAEFEEAPAESPPEQPRAHDGLIGLDGLDSFAADASMDYAYSRPPESRVVPSPETGSEADLTVSRDTSDIPSGEGKDHYDLGVVYKEMRLWDAATAEFEQARRDPSVRIRATLELVECMQETHDLQSALDLLEEIRQDGEGSPQEQLGVSHRLGIIHELLGNTQEALAHFERVHEQSPGFADVELRVAELRSKLDSDSPAM
ncbi:hypothetical protein EHM69_05565 [candidate division KSB1 bacterium]|nr:MAG: hypothetical protein EHM69_05565 [candidate division KSB1 bacterium]